MAMIQAAHDVCSGGAMISRSKTKANKENVYAGKSQY